MQIKLCLHLLSLHPFMLHIESGNKSLVEFMTHKSQTMPRADSADAFNNNCLQTTSCHLTRLKPVCVWHRVLTSRWSFKGQKCSLNPITQA